MSTVPLSLGQLWQEVGFEPNPNQREAILHVDGPLYLPAGPGSGKTRVLLWRTLNLCVFHGVSPEEIYLSTFTEKAAHQLKEGLRALFGIVTNHTGVPYDPSKMYIGTVHSLCQRLIADRRFYPNRHRGRAPSLLDELAQYFYVYKSRMWAELTQVAGLEDQANLKITSLFGGNGSLSKYLAVTNSLMLFNRLSEECIDPQIAMQQTSEPTLKAMLEMYAIYERSLGSAKGTVLTDFSLLQQKALQVLDGYADASNIFKHVIIDEYQDTNTIQERLFFRLAAGHKNICVVGDDDQALYRFRGATVENFVQFPERCQSYLGKEPRKIPLSTNYRSRAAIVRFYTDFMEACDWERPDHLSGSYRVTGKSIHAHSTDQRAAVVATTATAAETACAEIAGLVRELVETKKVENVNQIAFLFPSLKYNGEMNVHVRRMKEALEREGFRVYAPRAGRFLEVLKLLLKSYAGKVKMIYLDPPYNTGSDFIYKDNFWEPLEDYLRKTGQTDEEGTLLTTNKKAEGRYHSNWLSMMYPRLRLARQLLRDDGVIFISIDDHEVNNLRMLMNEIFGEESFFAQLVIRANSRGQTYKQIAKTHEYILVYLKDFETELYEIEKDAISNDLDHQDDISNFNLRELRNRNPKFGRHNRPNLFYSVFVNPNISDKDGLSPVSLEKTNEYCIEVVPLNSKDVESCWRWGKSKFSANCSVNTLKSNLVAKRKNNGEFSIFEKYRKTTYKPKSIWNDNSFLTETGTVELRELGLEKCFDFPKPVNLIKECLRLSTVEDDIILDFFAGSCSTAQAVFELNQEDDRNRHFIMVQLPEIIDERKYPEAAKEFHTAANVGKERIRRVIAKMHRESEGKLNLSTHENQEDLGFNVFKLSRSNYRAWQDYQSEDIQEIETLFDGIETPLIDGWDKADLTTEILLMQGFPLDSTIIRQDAFTYNIVQLVYSDVCAHRLFVCLDERIEDDTIEQSRLRPEDIFVCLDSALTDQSKMRLADVCNLNVI